MDIVLLILASLGLLGQGVLVWLALKNNKATAQFLEQVVKTEDALTKSISAVHVASQDDRNKKATAATEATTAIANKLVQVLNRLDEQDRQTAEVKKVSASVVDHMAIYRPVLESQDKLIAAVTALAEDVDSIRRRRR